MKNILYFGLIAILLLAGVESASAFGYGGGISSFTPSCSSFVYSAWSPSVCSASGLQTRTVTSQSPSDCTGGSPVLTQSCTYVLPPVITSVITPTITPAPTGQVLGVSTFNFNKDLRLGDSNSDVTELQTRLTAEGVYTGPITGTFGPLTLKAVKAYQTKKGLPQTGFVGPMTREALNSSEAPASTSLDLSSAQLQQFIEMLIQAGIISPDKAATARTVAGLL